MSEDLPEHTTEFDVYVGNNGVYVKTLEDNAGAVTATFELDGVDASTVDVYVAVYGEEGKLLAVDKEDIVNGTCSLNIGNSTGDTVLFVWEKSTMKPLYKETIR